MSESTTATQGTEGSGGTGSGAPPPASSGARPGTNGHGQGRDHDTIVADLRAEAASYRVELRKAQNDMEKLNERLTAKDTELVTKVAEATNGSANRVAKLQKAAISAALRASAVAAGIIDVDAISVIPQEGITVDDEGEIKGADEAVTKHKEAKPLWYAAAGTGGGQGSQQGGRPSASQGASGGGASSGGATGTGSDGPGPGASGSSRRPASGARSEPESVAALPQAEYRARMRAEMAKLGR
jgi:hypothetical protein